MSLLSETVIFSESSDAADEFTVSQSFAITSLSNEFTLLLYVAHRQHHAGEKMS